MASVVSICNLALSNIGKQNIQSLDEPGAEPRACKQFYEHSRDTLLQVYPWRFAGKTESLAEVANDKPGRWARAYKRPVDCLKIRWVRPEYSVRDPGPQTLQEELAYPHDAEGTTIYCDLSPAFLRYTAKLADPTRFSPMFIEALSWQLATRIAMPLTRDPKIRADCYQLAQATQSAAAEADANEVRETSDHESEFVAERG
ncbi:hypothetical protein [Hyphomicrobium sp. ghe19]|uniref:hypothetical protein n=1 Tax=Hyphomicrobium sp. ghe19 TaxID=2682968 RepID=UPI001366C65D|nr:hypothetical protein HYPP_01944 [Hyphomicrobium sp. ghe19]